MPDIADRIISFYKNLSFTAQLPGGIRIMNPLQEDRQVKLIMKEFYKKYFSDIDKRVAIIGINPGRLGGGLTGIPFTDPKRLKSECGIAYKGNPAHETSSAFIYEMIKAYGGPQIFYKKFYITAVCPLGFTLVHDDRKEVNYNYYDKPELIKAAAPFIKSCMEQQFSIIKRAEVICLGKGKNEKFLSDLNKKEKYFNKITALEHPRFIMQYHVKDKNKYIEKYLRAFEEIS